MTIKKYAQAKVVSGSATAHIYGMMPPVLHVESDANMTWQEFKAFANDIDALFKESMDEQR
jgi:hypothetical protein